MMIYLCSIDNNSYIPTFYKLCGISITHFFYYKNKIVTIDIYNHHHHHHHQVVYVFDINTSEFSHIFPSPKYEINQIKIIKMDGKKSRVDFVIDMMIEKLVLLL